VLHVTVRWVPESTREAVPIPALQLAAAAAALTPVFLLRW